MAERKPMERNARLCDKMKERISEIKKSRGGESNKRPCIFKFDQASDNDRFIPQVVSIGPYCRGNCRLQAVEEFKWLCLDYSVNKSSKNLKDYLDKISAFEQVAKECYSESSGLQTDEFLEMMVLDGCFIVEFIRFSYSMLRPEQHGMMSHPLAPLREIKLKICADLLMLQNQIPYKVLEKVFEVSEINLKGEPQSLSILSAKSFSTMLGASRSRSPPEVDWMHLLDLVRSIFIPCDFEEWSSGAFGGKQIPPRYQLKPFPTIPCVTMLHLKGIEVCPRREDDLEVKFINGTIEMPKIILNDLMCSFLQNCLTFEQRYNDRSKRFSVYALCLVCLVNTALDVEYLCKHQVIENKLNTVEEAAKFFKNLGKCFTIDWDYDDFYSLCRDVNDYCENICHRQWTGFKGEWFDKRTKEKCDKMNWRVSEINKSLGGDRSPCIFRFDQISYTDGRMPQVVSIGPYYRGNPRLHPMEEFKWQCLNYSQNKSGKKSEDYFEKIGALDRFPECYSESTGLQTDEFLEMMVLDGCFIIEFIRFSYSIHMKKKSEPFIMKNHPLARMERTKLPKICADLLMLHNQIPYKVLDQVFEVSKIKLEAEPQSLSTLSAEFFSAILGFHHLKNSPPQADWMHLLDLVRSIFIPSNYEGGSPGAKEGSLEIQMPPENWYNPYDTIPCVTRLRRVGIKVNPRREDGMVVNFHHGVIEMPKIILNDLMCSFLENCVTLEQRHNIRPKCFSVYALCLDCLVNTATDVEYLCERRVIENYLETDKEAAKFFNHLGKGLTFDCDYFNVFFRLCRSVNDYRQNACRRHRTSFKREYFDKPWLWISGLAAFVLLVLTFLQTYYTIYSYVHHKN